MNTYPLSPTIGTMPDHQIVGREKEIVSLLRLLISQSVSVEEIRRMGKTLLLQKLAYWCNNKELFPEEFQSENFKAKYFSFQGKQSLGEVIDYLIKELEGMKSWNQIDLSNSYKLIRKIINSPTIKVKDVAFTINLPEFKKSWKEIFYGILEDVASNQQKHETKLIIILDELPIMLWEWYKQGNHDEAMEFLDVLRERRQILENKGIRFIFCGSIGMKIVLNTFRNKFGYTGESTNDMEEFRLGAFTRDEVEFLCECFTLTGFETGNKNADLWEKVYLLTNGLPYYISKIFNIIQTENDKLLNERNIENAYHDILNDTNHHKAFNQLLERINIYYPKAKADVMKSVLSVLSTQSDFISEDEIVSKANFEVKEIIQSLYDLLSDHYLIREISNERRTYKFKYEIFRQWWKINRA